MVPHDFYILSKDGRYIKDITKPYCVLVEDVLLACPYEKELALKLAKRYGLDVEHFSVEIHIVSKGIVEVV